MGDYFIWDSDAKVSDKYMYFATVPGTLTHGDWITGKAMVKPPPVSTLVRTQGRERLSDIALTQFGLPILSPSLIAVLDRLGIQNLEYFPIKIKSKTKLDTTYKIANVVGLVSCLDWNHADLQTFSANPKKIMGLRAYSLLPEKLKGAPLIFRLGDFPYHVLVHVSVKEAVEQAGLTGSKFTPTEAP